MSKDNGGPAFPMTEALMTSSAELIEGSALPQEKKDALLEQLGERACGMTLRDYFAAKAVQGFLAEPITDGMRSAVTVITERYSGTGKEVAQHYAEAAYALADAMLAERSKQ